MNSFQRVQGAINKNKTDRTPRGEFWLASSLLKKMFPQAKEISMSDEICALKKLGIDMRAIPPQKDSARNTNYQPVIKHVSEAIHYNFPQPEQKEYEVISLWREKTDFFLFALLDGVFQGISSLMGFNTFLTATITDGPRLVNLVEKKCRQLIEQAKLAVSAGAHGILIGDDIAYNGGTYISPQSMRKLFFPGLKEAVKEIKKSLAVPVFFHSDGNLTLVLEDIVDMGFHGLHGIESGAGMDILEIKNRFGQELCLMGNLDVGFLAQAGSREVLEAATKLVEQVGAGGGFILGSSAGILEGDIPLENLLILKNIS